MQLYVGQTRDRVFVKQLQKLGVGECTNRGELPPRRWPWFLDNGAFTDWKSEKPFDANRWIRDTRHIMYRLESGEWGPEKAPDFTVVPDLVGGGKDSLDFSLEHLFWLENFDVPHYVAVQDGMTEEMVRSVLHNFGGIFVGGTLDWKLETMGLWAQMAHFHKMKCHVGRIGTIPRMKMARSLGVDSIDSCQPLWTRDRLEKFVQAVMGDDNEIDEEESMDSDIRGAEDSQGHPGGYSP